MGLIHLKNRINLAQDFFKKRTVCTGMPLEFSIELTSRCNLKCVMCPRSEDTPRGLGEMRLETFERILEEAGQYTEFVYLHLAGEPLLHPRFAEFIEAAAVRGIKVGMSTNGTLLDLQKAEVLLNSKLDMLVVSVDGTDADTYEKIRGVNTFDHLVNNIEAFLKLKKVTNNGPYTVLQMICMKENWSQAEKFVGHWKKCGADAVRLKRFFNFAGDVEDLSNGKVKNVAAGDGSRGPCFLLWRQMAIYYDGTVVSCCHDFLHKSEAGNIHLQSLRDIWNSEMMVDMRQKHLSGRQQEIALCAGCNQPKIDIPSLLGVTILDDFTCKKAIILLERMSRRLGLATPY
jgi:radical SAM protein with 4Fe4S-binding SPASM domain